MAEPDNLAREFETAFDATRGASLRDRFRLRFTQPDPANENAPTAQNPGQGGPSGGGAAPEGAKPETPSGGLPEPNAAVDRIAANAQALSQHREQADGNLGAVAGDVAAGVREFVPQAAAGVADAVNNLLGTVEDFDTLIEETLGLPQLDPTRGMRLPTTSEADSVTGGFVRSTAQFLTGFLPAAKAIKAAGGGAGFLQSMAAGAASDLVVWDPHEQRLSTYLNEVPVLAAVVPDYLADNNPENEGVWEGRLKNAVEGAGLGLAAEGLFRTFRAYKAHRAATSELRRAAASGADLAQQTARDAIRDAAVADVVQPMPPGALDGLGDLGGGYFVGAPRGETVAQAVRMERDARELRLISDVLPEGMAARFTKDGVSIIGPDRKRVAVIERPANVDESFLGAIGQRIDESGAVDQALAGVRDRILQASAKGSVLSSRGEVLVADPLDEMLTWARSGFGRDPAARSAKYPTLNMLKGAGGVKPGSPLAGNLKAKGITPRTMPGLFRHGGRGAADNLVASEHPAFAGFDDGNGYILEDAILDAIDEELAGNPRLDPELATQRAQWEEMNLNAEEFRRDLERLGVDFETMDNAAIRARIAQVEAERLRLAEMDETPGATGEAEFGGLAPDENVPPATAGGRDPATPSTGGGKVYINHARINSSDDVRALIQEMADLDADAIDIKRRGTVSNVETLRESAAEFASLEDLIGRKPGPMSAAEAVAARKILTTSGEQLVTLATRAQAADATPADVFAFRRAMQVHYAIQSEVIAARTETARALQSWAIPAGSSKQRADAIAELLNNQGGAGDSTLLARAIASLANNPAGLNVAVQQSMRGKLRDVLFEAWINGLLTSPKTHMVNATSNSLTALWSIPERLLAAGIDNVFMAGDIKGGEVAGQIYGLAKGVRDGFRFAASVSGSPDLADLLESFSKTEQNYGRAMSAATFDVDPNSAFGRGLDYAGAAIRSPGALLDMSDRFFKAVNYRMELHAQAFRQAATEGLEGEALAGRVADLLANPPENIRLEAIDVARINTFTKQLGEMGQKWQRAINSTPGGRLIVPFIRTPTNILKYTFARTPLGYLSTGIRADIAAGGPRAAQAHARIALGSMLFMTMTDYALEGVITGNGPADPQLRAAKMRSGWKPYSVKVGDRWFQYNRLDPLGMLVGMGADIGEIIGEIDQAEGEKLATAGVVAFVQNLASKTWTQGAFNLVSALDPGNPAGGIGNFVEDMAGSAIPFSSLLRHIKGVQDPVLRDTRTGGNPDEFSFEAMQGLPAPVAESLQTILNQYRKNIPGLGEDMPARKDLWGRDITTDTGLGWVYDFLSPIGGAKDKSDPVDDLIVENGIRLSMPDRTLSGVRLSAEEYAQFVTLAGEPAKEHLDRLVASPGFQRLSGGADGAQADVVKGIVSKYRDRAREQMMMFNPRLRERYIELQRDKRLRQTLEPQ